MCPNSTFLLANYPNELWRNDYEYSVRQMYHEMGILHICLKSRYPLNPTSLLRFSSLLLVLPGSLSCSPSTPKTPSFPSTSEFLLSRHRISRRCIVSSVGSRPIIHSVAGYSSISPNGCGCGYGYWYNCVVIPPRFRFRRTRGGFRLFSTGLTDLRSSESTKSSNDGDMADLDEFIVPSLGIESIVDIVRRDEIDTEFWLNSISKDISECDIIETLRTLNRLGLNASRFYRWIRNVNPHISRDSVLCSLMIDNSGRLGDYKTMLALLQDFGSTGILLTEDAFGFLCISNSAKELESSVEKLVKILKEANGTCYCSWIEALIKMFCAMNSFDMAKFVIEMNNKEFAYYKILVRESCLRGRFQEAQDTLHAMRQIGCDPDARTYNYLISCLCKYGQLDQACTVLEEMLETRCLPNAITFEVLICQFCKVKDLDRAVKSYQVMVSYGIEPRFSTCSAIIRGYFDSQQYEEAYNYLMHLSVSQKCFINRVYSFLASLHRKEGNLSVAYGLLMEMTGKGLKPDFEVHVKVCKDLYKSRKKDLASVLKSRFNSFVCKSSNK